MTKSIAYKKIKINLLNFGIVVSGKRIRIIIKIQQEHKFKEITVSIEKQKYVSINFYHPFWLKCRAHMRTDP